MEFSRSAMQLRILIIEEDYKSVPSPQSEEFKRLYSSLKQAQQVQYVSIIKSNSYMCRNMLKTAQSFIEEQRVNTIFIDLFSVRDQTYDTKSRLEDVIPFILQVRDKFPGVVFVLYLNFDKMRYWEKELYAGEGKRFAHYYKLDQRLVGERFDVAAGEVLELCIGWLDNYRKYAHGLYEYDVALSFAGEDRSHAEKLARCLRRHKVRVFYDSYEQARLWGADLYFFLHEIYSKKARYCVIFISSSYVTKMWTTHERKGAQERALHEREGVYILPIKLDEAELPGLPSTIAYLSGSIGIPSICKLLITKLNEQSPN